MKALTHPIPVLALAVAVGAAILSNLPLMLLGVLVAVASVGLIAAKASQESRSVNPLVDLPNDSKIRLRPVRINADRIEALVEGNATSQIIEISGKQALETAKSVLAGSAVLTQRRSDLGRLIQSAPPGSNLKEVQTKIEQIDEMLHQAERSLSVLYDQLAAGVANDGVSEIASQKLRDSLASSTALSRSFEEMDQLLSRAT